MSQKRTLSILVLVLAVLLVLYGGLRIYQNRQSDDSDDTITIKDLSSLTSISYNNGEDLSFVKEDGTWYYKNNKNYPIAQDTVDNLASTFQKMEAVRRLGKGDGLDDYGLKNPSYTVTVKDKDGTETSFYIGNAAGENYYLTVDDKSTIYTVSSDVVNSLSSTLDDFIQKDTFPTLSSGNITKVVVTQDGKKTTYKSDDDIDSIGGGLGTFTFGNCENYAASDSDLSKYGLDEDSQITVKVSYKDTDDENEKKSVTLCIGSKDSSGDYYYVKLSNSDMVYLGDADVIKNILNP